MTDRLLEDYVQDIRALTRLDADDVVEQERIALARQASLAAAYGLVRDADARIAETGEALRTAERRAEALARRHPVTPVEDGAVPADLTACREALRGLAAELDEIDKADAWLDRARAQVASATAERVVVPPPPAAASPAAASTPAAAVPTRSGTTTWYWWVAGVCGVGAGVVVLVVSLASGR